MCDLVILLECMSNRLPNTCCQSEGVKWCRVQGSNPKSHAWYQAKHDMSREKHKLGPHGDKKFSVKKVYFNNCQNVFLHVVYIPKKVQNKTSTSKD